MSSQGNERGQMLLAEEYFSSQHDGFVLALRNVSNGKTLASFTDRWKNDPRPWARLQMLEYLQHPLDCQGHQPVVKRLFKHSEGRKDHELMAAFLASFDVLVRRQINTVWRWDRNYRSGYQEDVLSTPRDVIPLFSADRRSSDLPFGGRMAQPPGARIPKGAKLFKHTTRHYLRRRAWRYFRYLGHQQPQAYVAAIIPALVRYTDDDLQLGENVIDSRNLLKICYGESTALEFGKSHVRVKEGQTLGDLTPAPSYPELWQQADVAPILFGLISRARSRFIRTWASELLQREHPTFVPSCEDLLKLLEHEDTELQQFGSQLLQSAPWLGTLPVTDWMKLLQTRNDEALQRICDVFVKQVTPDRFNLAQTIDLACFQPVPVARVGLKFLRERKIESATDRTALLALTDAKCPAVAGELTAWALGILGTKAHYNGDQIIRFFDSIRPEIREAAWTWLIADSPGLRDPVLWSRLIETPFDDLRLRLIDHLQRQEKLPTAEADSLTPVWRSVLLGVHRGGRQKSKAVKQIAQAIQAEPVRAETLLPVLAVAVRSVRGPEARAGLAAIASVMATRPELTGMVQQHLPELKLLEVGA